MSEPKEEKEQEAQEEVNPDDPRLLVNIFKEDDTPVLTYWLDGNEDWQ